MKTLENYIAPTEHSQGDVGDIWIDKSTGDVYKCTGITGSAKDLGYITIGADATNTKYTWEKAGAGGGGNADIKLSEITFATDGVEYMLYGAIMDETGTMVSTNEMVEDGKVYYLPYSSAIAIESYDGDCFINADPAQSVINLISSGAGNFAMCIIGDSGNINLVSASPD